MFYIWYIDMDTGISRGSMKKKKGLSKWPLLCLVSVITDAWTDGRPITIVLLCMSGDNNINEKRSTAALNRVLNKKNKNTCDKRSKLVVFVRGTMIDESISSVT